MHLFLIFYILGTFSQRPNQVKEIVYESKICKYCIVNIVRVVPEYYRHYVLISLSKPKDTHLGQRIFGQNQQIDSVIFVPYLRPHNASYMFLTLIASGDIQVNPGPKSRTITHPCTVCERAVIKTSKIVLCDKCNGKTHARCISKHTEKCVKEGKEVKAFICNKCSYADLPFSTIHGSDEPLVLETPNLTTSFTESTSHSTTRLEDEHFECFESKGLHFIHMNARSLLPKMSELRRIARKTRAAAIAISESWLDESITEGEVSIEGYCMERVDRNRNGGGVCLYVNNKLAYTCINDITSSEEEMLCVNIYLPKSKPIILGVCYRPPKQSNFIDKFEDKLAVKKYLMEDLKRCEESSFVYF